MESQLQRERQRRMEEEMRGKKEQERREEAEREKVMGLDINQDGEFCQEMMVMEDGGQEQGGKKMPKIDTLDALNDEMTSIFNIRCAR